MKADTIQIWHGNIAAEDADYQSHWRVLDATEQDHAERIKIDLVRKRYVEAHGRLRKALAQTLNELPKKIRIKKTEYGKPYLPDTPELVFNLSHSAEVMVIAVGRDCRLGVDIEICKARTSLSGMVEKCFGEEEITYWNAVPEAEKIVEFYRFWTRKEAFVKATGRGIALGLDNCVINPENQAEFLRVPSTCGQASMWHVRDMLLGQGICSALVTDKEIGGVRFMDFESLM